MIHTVAISLFLVVVQIPLISSTSTVYQSVLKKQQYVDILQRNAYELDSRNYIYLSTEDINPSTGAWYRRLIYLSRENNGEEQLLAKTDVSDGFYGDTLLFYQKPTSDKQVFMWKQEGEYWSYIYIYLFHQDSVVAVGDLSVGLSRPQFDTFNFPANLITVRETNKELIISFTGQTIFTGARSQNIPYHSVKVITDSLRILYDEGKSELRY